MSRKTLEFLEDYLQTLEPESAAVNPGAATYREELKLEIEKTREKLR